MGPFLKLKVFEINLFVTNRLDIKTLMTFPNEPIKRFTTVCGLNPNPEHTKADPFLFVHGERLFLFYETDGYKLGRGVITMVSTTDLQHWTKPKIVLQEPFHLSYPFTFEKSGVVYMIPESSESGEIRLYRATDAALSHFELVKPIMSGRYLDSSFMQCEGKYYLFTTNEPQYREYALHLFYSDSFDGPYTEHPMSPICTDTEYSRCGGKPIEIDGRVCRVSQDCSNGYGDNISLISIDRISPIEYSERLYFQNLFDRSSDIFRGGGHHLTCVKFKDKYVIATDCKHTKLGLRNFYSFISRLKK